MFAHLCCWFHRIASYCAGVVSPTLFHFLRITFLISCNSFFFVRCRLLDITFHWNSEFGLFIYININRLYGELKNRCVVRFCEKFEKRFIEMSRWKKSVLHALMFFRGGKSKHVFQHKHANKQLPLRLNAYKNVVNEQQRLPVNLALICLKMKCSQLKAISFNDMY